ncbi:hypothetical protein [uncultured Bradyrhizobium sp.]|uniref:hypothetical protein n=1 Tax=uncultured Bradyrhizobium sp. TaxID=199684 RepID=UPI0035CA110E
MALAPVYIGTPQTWQAALTAANSNMDGTGTIVDVVTGGSSGSRIDKVRVVASGTTSVGKVRFFLYDGSNTYMIKEVLVSAIVPSTSIEAFVAEWDADGLVLPSSSWKLRASTHNAEAFKVFAKGGNF